MKLLIGGNWKMNASVENIKLFEKFKDYGSDTIDIFIAVPFIFIEKCIKSFPKGISVAAQDISTHEKGAYTGEISANYLKEYGVKYVIIGHSERRIHHFETNEEINEKLKISLLNEIRPVLCIGESLEMRKSNRYMEFLLEEFKNSCKDLEGKSFDVAYEPVWAIGTGEKANDSQIIEMISQIKIWMKERRIIGRCLYGGSVSIENISELKKIECLDGFLIGNASLDESFIQMINELA